MKLASHLQPTNADWSIVTATAATATALGGPIVGATTMVGVASGILLSKALGYDHQAQSSYQANQTR